MRRLHVGMALVAGRLAQPLACAPGAGAAYHPALGASVQPGRSCCVTVSGTRRARNLEAEVFGKRFQFYPAGERRWACLVGVDLEWRPPPTPLAVQGRAAGAGAVTGPNTHSR